MTIESKLLNRCNSQCELCKSTSHVTIYTLPPAETPSESDSIIVCDLCDQQLQNWDTLNPAHWRCLNDSMWSTVPAVQVLAWRLLMHLRPEGWPQDLLDMLYLDDDLSARAKSGYIESNTDSAPSQHKDCHGAPLESGDNVTLIKDLNVKGAGFTAKRGTAVRNISLVVDNPSQIEGRVNGQRIVILTEFVKKMAGK